MSETPNSTHGDSAVTAEAPAAPNAAALFDCLASYLQPEQISLVKSAYEYARQAHAKQRRASGEPYIIHPVAVAQILANMGLDHESLAAAILHDVIEDTDALKRDISEHFTANIAELVDGVSKLDKVKFQSQQEAQAQNFRKMVLAMTEDIRVILIKLADRTHNMQTLHYVKPEKQRRIARETLEVYAPIAQRLGINHIRLELEELGFKYSHPWRYQRLTNAINRARQNRREIVDTMVKSIEKKLANANVKGEVTGREKHIYGIYCKLKKKILEDRESLINQQSTEYLSQVRDIFGIRILVKDLDTCYRTFGVVHTSFTPIHGRFKDYIAVPKSNGYQSLHTAVRGPSGIPIEVQIRTEIMDVAAESGITAHWVHKTDDDSISSPQLRAREWVQRLLDLQSHSGTSVEFLEQVKVDLFPDEVYVFTPKGDILRLPRGATPVDFAYAVHSDIGNNCLGARLNGRRVMLRTTLKSGQTVSIITDPNAHPNPAWLSFVTTAKARTAIRNYLRTLQATDAERLGKQLLERALTAYSTSINQLEREHLPPLLAELDYSTANELYADIGLGNRLAPIIARRLLNLWGEQDTGSSNNERRGMKRLFDVRRALRRNKNSTTQPLFVRGTQGTAVSTAKCCHPIPNDPIVGVISSGRGLVVHHEKCRNLASQTNRPEEMLDLQWEDDITELDFSMEIALLCKSGRGVLATIASEISKQDANILSVRSDDEDENGISRITFILGVRNRKHLAQIMRKLRGIKEVQKILRPGIAK